MHELSLCGAIATTALDRAAGRAVVGIRVQIGHFRQVVPDTLQFCWEMSTKDTELDGCVLDVEHVPATLRCRACDAVTVLDHPVMLCGTCGSLETELLTGEEFLLESIDLDTRTDERTDEPTDERTDEREAS